MHQLIWNRPAEDFCACILPRQTRSGPTFSLYVYTAISMVECLAILRSRLTQLPAGSLMGLIAEGPSPFCTLISGNAKLERF